MTRISQPIRLRGDGADRGRRPGARAKRLSQQAIHFIVGFAAGGGNDLFARLVVRKFPQDTGATTVIENKSRAGGRISSQRGGHDARTAIRVGRRHRAESISTAIYPNLSYHPIKSFIPLNMIASFPLILVVPADGPAKRVKELIA